MFSSTFLLCLIIASLVWTAIGVITLVTLLVRDWKKHELW